MSCLGKWHANHHLADVFRRFGLLLSLVCNLSTCVEWLSFRMPGLIIRTPSPSKQPNLIMLIDLHKPTARLPQDDYEDEDYADASFAAETQDRSSQ